MPESKHPYSDSSSDLSLGIPHRRPRRARAGGWLGGPHNAVFVVWEMRSFSPVTRKALRPTLNSPTQVEAPARLLSCAPKSRASRGTSANIGLEWATRPDAGRYRAVISFNSNRVALTTAAATKTKSNHQNAENNPSANWLFLTWYGNVEGRTEAPSSRNDDQIAAPK